MHEKKRVRGRFLRNCRAGCLLLRTICPRLRAGKPPIRRVTREGTVYDLYEPARTPERTWILLYGMDPAGERDPRVVKLADALVKSRFRIAVPCLSGLKSLDFDRRDKAAITDLAAELRQQHGGPIGIMGFSAGAGIALTVAAEPRVADLIDPLLLFGPYYCLSDLWNAWRACDRPAPSGRKQWDTFIWTQMVAAFHNLDSLSLPPAQRRELVELLEDYCREKSLRRKRDFYERVLKGQNVHGRGEPPWDEQTLGELSPRGRIDRIRSRVLMVHDPSDRLIPREHADRIMEELRLRGRPGAEKLLVTPLLSHVNVSAVWRIADVFRIVRLVGEVFVPRY